MDILNDYKEGYLELIDEAKPKTLDKIKLMFKELENSTKSQNIKGVSSLEKANPNDIMFLDLSDEPITALPSKIKKCVNLKALDLSRTSVKDFEILSSCKSLQALFIEECELKHLPKEIYYLNNLITLNLNNNKISSFDEIEGLKLEYLTGLNISDNKLKAIPRSLLSGRNLSGLHVQDNKIEEIPAEVFENSDLYQLELYSNPIKIIPEAIGDLRNLHFLDIDFLETAIIPKTIGKLFNLKTLFINGPFIEKIPEELCNCTKLEILSLGGDRVKKLIGSFDKLENLKTLNISGAAIEKLSQSIFNIQTLEELGIEGNSSIDLNKLEVNLPNLKELVIKECNLKEFPSVFSNCCNLEDINLQWNNIKKIKSDIGKFSKLKYLVFENNKIQSISAEIGELVELVSLNLYSNKLKSIPLEISNLKKLTSLFLLDNPFTKMPEIPKMGIDELFKYFNKLRGIGDYTLIWELPYDIQIAFQQYLQFFTEFYEKMTSEKIDFKISRIEKGLKIDMGIGENSNIDTINGCLKMYLDLARENGFKKLIDESEDMKAELFKLKLENQINHLHQQLKQAHFENKYLKGVVDNFFSLQMKQLDVQNRYAIPKLISNESNITLIDKIKRLIAGDKIELAIEEMMMKFKNSNKETYNQVILLNSKFSRIEKESKIGLIDLVEKERQMSILINGLIQLVDEIKK